MALLFHMAVRRYTIGPNAYILLPPTDPCPSHKLAAQSHVGISACSAQTHNDERLCLSVTGVLRVGNAGEERLVSIVPTS